jgi:hypothetical protein
MRRLAVQLHLDAHFFGEKIQGGPVLEQGRAMGRGTSHHTVRGVGQGR